MEVEADDKTSQAIARIGEAESDTYELPTCPVCLERMDSAVTGLVTVPCSHTFHCTCLSKWGDSRCVFYLFASTVRIKLIAVITIDVPYADIRRH